MTRLRSHLAKSMRIFPERVGKFILLLPIGVFLLAGAGMLPLVEVAAEQLHHDTATPSATRTLRQTFVLPADGVAGVDIFLSEPTASSLQVRVLEMPAEREAASVAAFVDQNQQFHFRFERPIRAAQSRDYALELGSGTSSMPSLQMSSIDTYRNGRLSIDGSEMEGDLRFKIYSACGWTCLLRELGAESKSLLALTPALFIVLVAPGWLIAQRWGFQPDDDLLVRLALCISLGLAVVPMIWLWATVMHVDVTQPLLTFLFGILSVIAILRLVRDWRNGFGDKKKPELTPDWGWLALCVAILGLILAVRLLQIRYLVLPPWVDAVKHASVAQLLLLERGVPATYRPLLAVDDFFYHFGYHSVLVSLATLSGWSIERVMLVFGQVLSALAPLTSYALAYRLSSNRWAGLIALTAVGLITTMPSRYITWSRYTLLMGVVILPIAILLVMRLLCTDKAGATAGPCQKIIRVVITAGVWAGLFLTHYRIFLFGSVFVLVWWTLQAAAIWRRNHGPDVKNMLWMGALATLFLLLLLPWLWNTFDSTKPRKLLSMALFGIESTGILNLSIQNIKQFAYLFTIYDWLLLSISLILLLMGLLIRRRIILIVMLWCGIWFTAANTEILGFRVKWFSDDLTFFSTVYLPVVLVISDMLSIGMKWIATHVGKDWLSLCRRCAWVGIVSLGIWGGWGMLDMVQPTTVIATSADVEALRWVQDHVPPQARFLISSRLWADSTHIGVDGGYWLPALSKRQATLPWTDYSYMGWNDYTDVNNFATLVERRTGRGLQDLHRLLWRRNITHVYVGALGTGLSPAELARDPGFEVVFSNGSVWIFVERAAKPALLEAKAYGASYPIEVMPYDTYLPSIMSRVRHASHWERTTPRY